MHSIGIDVRLIRMTVHLRITTLLIVSNCHGGRVFDSGGAKMHTEAWELGSIAYFQISDTPKLSKILPNGRELNVHGRQLTSASLFNGRRKY